MSALVLKAKAALQNEVSLFEKKIRRLTNLDFFILDNSIRESTVGQLRSHTIEDKKAIYQWIKKCHVHSVIVASFSNMHGVDDEFCQWLKDRGEDFSGLFSFSEVISGKIVDGIPDTETIPISLLKNLKYGLYNVIFEVDLADPNVSWGAKWTVRDMCRLIQKWMFWVYDNMNSRARILLNIRDLPVVMNKHPESVLSIVEFLARMPAEKRMLGLAYEDPLGESMPDEMAAWTRAIRTVMDSCGWKNGRLLNHVHEKWGLQTGSTLECLAAGSDGVWASLCEEGAPMGHASSTVTLLNLVRLGNKKVLGAYNCKEFRKAAIAVTELTTMKRPHPTQCVYGERALDLVYGFIGVGDFNLGDFFGESTENRMTTLATPEMIMNHLTFLFGSDPQFMLDMGKKMIKKMHEDLISIPPRKEEYQSSMGLAVLFNRCGGSITEKMSQTIAKLELSDVHHKRLVAEIRELWDLWDRKETKKRDGALDFESFCRGFLRPYLGYYRCVDSKQALQLLDMNGNGQIDWEEFMVYIKWALVQYPDVMTSDEAIEIALQKGLLPALLNKDIETTETSFR